MVCLVYINKNELTKEMLAKAMQCETAEDLMAFAEKQGISLTKAEAEAYLAELKDVELDKEALQKVAGGDCYQECATYKPSCKQRYTSPP